MGVELKEVPSAHLIEYFLRLHVEYMIGDMNSEKMKKIENRQMIDC